MKLISIIHAMIGVLAFASAAHAQTEGDMPAAAEISLPDVDATGNKTLADVENPEIQQMAHQLFVEGVAFFGEKRLDEAVIKFRAAYDLRPSWKLLYNIGQCEAGLKKFGRAIVAFEKYLGQGGDEIEITRQDEVLRELDRLKRMVGKIVVDGPEGYIVWVDGQAVGNSPIVSGVVVPIGVEHEVVVRKVQTSEEVSRFNVAVSGGETMRLTISPPVNDAPEAAPMGPLQLKPLETVDDEIEPQQPEISPEPVTEPSYEMEASGPTDQPELTAPALHSSATPQVDGKKKLGPAFFIVSLSTAVVSGVTTGILLGMINSKWKKSESNFNENPWAFDDGEKQSIRNLQVASYLTGGVTVLALAATAISIPLTNWHRDKPGHSNLNITPFGARSTTGIVVTGSF